MSLVILDIKNEEKGKYLIDFLKQIDYLEIKENMEIPNINEKSNKIDTLEDVFLNAPILSEEEIRNIESIGKELNNWKIKEF